MNAIVRIKWHGLDQLRRDLSTFAVDLTDDTRPIALELAEQAASQMRALYPRSGRAKRRYAAPVGGPLADAVVVREQRSGRTTTAIEIENRAYYAGWFEFGTRYADPHRVFVPIYFRARRALTAAITARVFPKFNLRTKAA